MREDEILQLKSEIKKREELIEAGLSDLFSANPDFKKWIENTQLFHAIMQDASRNGSIRVHGANGEVNMTLDLNGRVVTKAEDLPLQIVMNFYENYPDKPQYINQNKLGNEQDFSEYTEVI